MPVLVVVEGPIDRATVEAIAERENLRVKTLLMRGNNPGKAVRLVKAVSGTEKPSKVVVLKDQHRYPKSIVNRLLKRISSSLHDLGVKVYTIKVRKAIETWLLAGLVEREINAEEIDDPVESLNHILIQRFGKRYVKSPDLARSLAKSMDLNKALQRSQTLKTFLEAVKDP